MDTRNRRSSARLYAGLSKLPDIVLDGREAKTDEASFDEILRDALRAIRLHLGMDVAFVSEFANGRRIFRLIDTHLD